MELEWLVYWESIEVDKFPSLHESQEPALKEDGQVRNPFPIFGTSGSLARPSNESFAKLLGIFIGRHLKMNSFGVDGEGCATIEGVSSVILTVVNRLAATSEPLDVTATDWVLTVFRTLSQLDGCQSKVSHSLTMAFKKALLDQNPKRVVFTFFLAWVHHSGSAPEEFPGVQYGTWLKQALQTVSTRFSSNPKLLDILALAFGALVSETPLYLIAEHVKLVMYTPTITQQQFAQFRKEALASIKKMLQESEESVTLEELLAKGGSADGLTPLAAVVLFQKSGGQSLPPRLVSESMFHPTWFQSQFIPELLHSTDPKIMELSQARNDLVNMLYSAGKIPKGVYRKFHAISSSDPPAKRQKKVAFDEDSFMASLVDLEGELEDIHESLSNSHRGVEFTGRLVQQQMSIESKFLAMVSKLDYLTRGSQSGTRLLKITDVELDNTSHFLTSKTSFKNMCSGLPGTVPGSDPGSDGSNSACSGAKAAHVFLSFFVSLAYIISNDFQSSRLVFERIALLAMNHPIMGLALYTCAMSWIYQMAATPHLVLDARWQGKIDFDLCEAFGKILAELDWLTYEPNYSSRFLFRNSPKRTSPMGDGSVCPLFILSNPGKSAMSWPSVLIHEILCWRLHIVKASPHVFKVLDSFASHRQQQTPPGKFTPASVKSSSTLVEYLRSFPSLSSNKEAPQSNPPYIPFPVWVHLERELPPSKSPTNAPIDDAEFLFSYFKDRYLSTSGVDSTNEDEVLSALSEKISETKQLLQANTIYSPQGLVCDTRNHAALYDDASPRSTHMSVPFFCAANETPIPQPKGLAALLDCLDI
ncbi:hypothetical protein DSO57_1027034 [Entomophthora muscae]|nr:hypothetical protein DSO57_1027034 [Entomophthora muscae]